VKRLALALAVAAGCRGAPCKPSSLFLELTFLGAAADATSLEVVLSLDGAPEQRHPLERARAGASETLEIDLPDYSPGAMLQVRVDTLAGGSRTGSATGRFALAPSCTVETLSVGALECPQPTTTQPAFVDPLDGSDDMRHGGGTGVCANKTLTFALGYAPGPIVLAPGTYQAPDETLPFVLIGAQTLDCGGATLTGSAPYPPRGVTVTVVLDGTANQIQNCKIVGGSSTVICVYVDTAGAGAGHIISDCDISQCPGTMGKGSNIEMDAPGDHVSVSHTTLRDGWIGIGWYGIDHIGTMSDNTFSGMRDADIFCGAAEPSPQLSGSGNVHSVTGAACFSCSGCPF